MKAVIPAILVVLIMTVSAYAAEGMVDVKGSFGVKETGDRIESVLKVKFPPKTGQGVKVDFMNIQTDGTIPSQQQ